MRSVIISKKYRRGWPSETVNRLLGTVLVADESAGPNWLGFTSIAQQQQEAHIWGSDPATYPIFPIVLLPICLGVSVIGYKTMYDPDVHVKRKGRKRFMRGAVDLD